MTEAQRYDASLFNQFLANEIRKAPHDLRGSVGRALVRFSPGATPKQQLAYTDSLLSTIADEDGQVVPNWPERVLEEHWSA